MERLWSGSAGNSFCAITYRPSGAPSQRIVCGAALTLLSGTVSGDEVGRLGWGGGVPCFEATWGKGVYGEIGEWEGKLGDEGPTIEEAHNL